MAASGSTAWSSAWKAHRPAGGPGAVPAASPGVTARLPLWLVGRRPDIGNASQRIRAFTVYERKLRCGARSGLDPAGSRGSIGSVRPLHSRLTIASVLLAALIFVGVRSLGTPGGRRPPDPASSLVEDLPGPIPEPLAEQAIPLQRAAPAGPQPTGAAIRLDILGDDSYRLSGQPVRAEDLARALAFLADEDRGGSTRNRVSRRELLVRAPADLQWAAVRQVLLDAAGPPVGIHRIFLALPQGTPVSVSIEPGWVAADQDDEIGR